MPTLFFSVPEWYYTCVFGEVIMFPVRMSNNGIIAVTFMFACVTIEVWPSGLPIWALLLALAIGWYRDVTNERALTTWT
jgi:EamA domain-containing membrane protein RarD